MNTGWSGEDVRGFSKIFGNQTSIYYQVKDQAAASKSSEEGAVKNRQNKI
jgi:argininosuccinate synthase